MPPLPTILYTYALLSLITFIVYAGDKRRAVHGGRRVRESGLHLLELLGGWPGGLLAQHILHHKNRKLSYQLAFWLIVALHIAAWILIARR